VLFLIWQGCNSNEAMRPALLDPLFAPLSTLPGVGPKVAKLFDKLIGREDGARVADLLLHLPYAVTDRQLQPSVRDAPHDQVVTLALTIEDHRKPPRPRTPFRVIAGDETGDIALVFFNTRPGQIESMLPIGAKRIVSGRLELFEGFRQIVQPERVIDPDGPSALPPFEPVYPLTEGLGQRQIAKVMREALKRLPKLPEWQNAHWLAKQKSPDFASALSLLHQPDGDRRLADESPDLARLAFDEILASQLALQMIRARLRRGKGRGLIAFGALEAKIRAALPFAPTGAQERALGEIKADLAEPQRMLRLLQGDVGAGKTLVALFAMLHAVEAGSQAAMMAPTEILARQHFARLKPLAAEAGVSMTLLTGKMKAAERRVALESIQTGAAQIVVGTHALFQDDVAFKDLAFAVVDEQHRFGVHQRLALGQKGGHVDLLVMTATPIPRTLVLSYFGDMDVSILDEKPPGRKPIDTRILSVERLDEVVGSLLRAMESGARIYWVCPLVAESEQMDAVAAEARTEDLKHWFGDKVGLVHGKMTTKDKDEAIRAFASGETSLLVATTVIEVGIDIPQATIMVIEEAERFGLAQLHQLRGRIGRGGDRSTCILLYKGPLSENGTARLKTMRETEDGFRIAEADLKLRGEGDLLGTRQSGAPGFRIARLSVHQNLIAAARDDARLILDRDPELSTERGQALRILLYLFGRDEAVKLLKSG
jgi:ATP-dependent DNA helicase RecG